MAGIRHTTRAPAALPARRSAAVHDEPSPQAGNNDEEVTTLDIETPHPSIPGEDKG
ncbi:MAG: hypothetical protein ACRDYA_17560 [Egibacteraceae bacterium]